MLMANARATRTGTLYALGELDRMACTRTYTPTKVQRIGFPHESCLPNHRRMVRTKDGYVTLAPRLTKKADWVVVCNGGAMLLVVKQDGEHRVLVDKSYAYGSVHCEPWEEDKCIDKRFK
jgi:hypothetical protein